MDSKKNTTFGFIAILIWGTSAAFTKRLSSNLGAFTAASLVNIIGGIFAISKQVIFDGGLKKLKEAPKKYWILCGPLFIIYSAACYISMSMVFKQEEVMTLVLIRFLWPLFTLVLTIPILKEKASPWLIASVTLSFIGIVIAKVGNDVTGLSSILQSMLSIKNGGAYALGFVVSISWALYTNLTRKFIKDKDVDGVGIYMLISGIALGLIALFVKEPKIFSFEVMGELLYQAVIASFIANILWNMAIKKGNMIIVVLASNFLPIISTVMTALMLGLNITIPVLLGALLVVIGTLWSKRCFVNEQNF